MHRHLNRPWFQRPWLWGGVGLMLLNLWSGCNEPPAKQPVSKAKPAEPNDSQPHADKVIDADANNSAVTPPSEKSPAESGTAETPPAVSAVDDAASTKPNEKDLFEGWPQPAALLLLSGDQRGYIEPCGCAGLENQKGGLKRRHTFVEQMRERGWPMALFDLGEQVRRYGIQPEIKFRTAIQSLEKIGYDAIGFGPDDLQLPAEQLLLLDLPGGKSPFVSANVVNEFAPEMIVPYKVVKVGDKKIGVTTILGAANRDRIRNEGIQIQPAAEALATVLPKLQAEADFLVLLASSTLEEAMALGKRFPAFNLVVTASGADEPPLDIHPIEGTEQTYLVDLGSKAMFLAAIGLYEDADMPLRYKPIPLDKRFTDSPEMQKMFKAYQRNLKAIGLQGLDLHMRSPASGSKFVGSQACANCHITAAEIWGQTPHAHATQTLIDLDPPRQFDAECLSCHVTGWELNPGTYVPYLSGYLDEAQSPHLFGNGCENCHGPGSAHVDAESGEGDASDEMLQALRAQMRLPLAKAEATCVKCHDHDNSPEFDFAKYWPQVEHKGKD
jgi:hypothetical protein